MTKSCKNCPSFLRAEEVPNTYGRGIGSAMCARFGTVLEVPKNNDAQNAAIQTHNAENCSHYGESRPPSPGRKHMVMLPDPVVRSRTPDPTNQSVCTSCAMCVNFIREDIVADELGWTSGLCAARGKLIMSNRQAQEARNCEYREFGQVRSTVGGMQFLPEFEASFGGAGLDPIRAYFEQKASGGFIEPSEYASDKEVTEEERTAGIQAWRKFDDPAGSGNSIFFPVYDASFFDDEERALIPKTGSDEHPELYVDHFGGMYGLGVAWTELDETPVFWGQPGVGKTELARHAAWIMQAPFRRISVTADTDVDDIAGKMMYSPDKGTYFKYGRLPSAWTKPGVICLDEPNVAQDPAVWHFIRPLTDNSKQLVLDMNEGETIDRNLDCYLALCMNPAWDMRNVGALEIADADANRLFHTYIEMPPPSLEREIISERVKLDGWELSNEQMDMIMGIAADIRGLSDDQELPITWAIRQQIKVARALRWFTPPVAYRRAAGDYLSPDAGRILMDQVEQHWTGA